MNESWPVTDPGWIEEYLCETCPACVEIKGYPRCEILDASGGTEDFEPGSPRCYRHREYVAIMALLNEEKVPEPTHDDLVAHASAMAKWRDAE
jgi:hypothetical protein